MRRSSARVDMGEAERPSRFRKEGASMKTIAVRIPRYRVTRTGRIVKTGTITRHVRIRKK